MVAAFSDRAYRDEGQRRWDVSRVLSDAQLDFLLEGGEMKVYPPAEQILNEGEVARYVFVITEGSLAMSKVLPDGKRQVIRFFSKGDFVGLTAGLQFSVTLETLTFVRTYRIPLTTFQRLLRDSPDLDREMLERAAEELVEAREHIALLGRKTAQERLASFLLRISEDAARRGESPDLVLLTMTRAHIADYLGLTVETVSRVFSLLRERQVIRLLPHGGVLLLDRERLQSLAKVN